jgi:hypothetical protein
VHMHSRRTNWMVLIGDKVVPRFQDMGRPKFEENIALRTDPSLLVLNSNTSKIRIVLYTVDLTTKHTLSGHTNKILTCPS